MPEHSWAHGRLLAHPLLILLLMPVLACTQPPSVSPRSPRADSPTKVILHRTTVEAEGSGPLVSTDTTTSSPLLQTIANELRSGRLLVEPLAEQPRLQGILQEHHDAIEEEIESGGVRLAQYLTAQWPPATDVLHWMFLVKRAGRADLLPYFRSHINDPRGVSDWGRTTPLHLAGSVEEVAFLLAEGVPIDATDSFGQTPLRCFLFGSPYAPFGDDQPTGSTLEMAKFLLDHGANPDPVMRGRSLLVESLRLGQHYRLLLAKGANPNGRPELGDIPVFAARDGDCVQALREYGADLLRRDKYGRTALFFPTTASKVDVLLDAGCRVDDRALSGETPLHEAASLVATEDRPEGADGLVRLIERGADVGAKDLLGRTPLHMHMNRELLRRGADVNARDIRGQTPVHYYARSFDDFCSSLRMMQDLPDVKPDLNAQDSAGRTPLHWLAWQGGFAREAIEDIISSGARVNVRDKFGQTPLDYARMTRNEDIETLLVQNSGEAATSVTASMSDGGDFLDPFARVRELAERGDDDFSEFTDGDAGFPSLYAWIEDLNNDGYFDVAVGAGIFRDRVLVIMMGTADGKFRSPEFAGTDPKSKPYLAVYGSGLRPEPASKVSHGTFWVHTGRKAESSDTDYECDAYLVRTN